MHAVVTVIFVDYGIWDTVKLENIRLDIQYEEIPIFALPCTLYNIQVPNRGNQLGGVKALWPVETLEVLYTLLVEQQFCITIKNNGLPLQILMHSKSFGSVNKILVQLGLAEFVEKPQKKRKKRNIV